MFGRKRAYEKEADEPHVLSLIPNPVPLLLPFPCPFTHPNLSSIFLFSYSFQASNLSWVLPQTSVSRAKSRAGRNSLSSSQTLLATEHRFPLFKDSRQKWYTDAHIVPIEDIQQRKLLKVESFSRREDLRVPLCWAMKHIKQSSCLLCENCTPQTFKNVKTILFICLLTGRL